MSEEQSAAAAAFARQRAAMAVEGLTCHEKAVLLVLAIMGDRHGRSHPSIAQIAQRASVSRRAAFNALDVLAARGVLIRDTKQGVGTTYTLQLDQCIQCTSAPDALVHHETPTRAPGAPKQPVTPKRKKTTSSPSTRTAATNAYPMPDDVDPDHWRDFLANRKRKRLPNTASAHKSLMDDLARHATDAWPVPRLIAYAAGKGWASVRNPEGTDHGRRGQPVPASPRGPRPDPALDLRRIALAEIEAEERAAARQADDSGPWLALPPIRDG